MKVFRLVLAGLGAAFVLVVCIKPLVGAAPIGPQLTAQSPFTRNDTVRQLSFANRVAYQRAIEEVYWRHRIWPRSGATHPKPKPSLDAVVSQASIEQKVQDYLRNSALLEEKWKHRFYWRCSVRCLSALGWRDHRYKNFS